LLTEKSVLIEIPPGLSSRQSEWIPIRLIMNPTIRELFSMLSKAGFDKQLRGLIVGDDVYFWDANLAIHAQVAKVLLDKSSHDSISYKDYRDDCLELHHRDSDIPPILLFTNSQFDRIVNHPRIRPLLDTKKIVIWVSGMGDVTIGEYESITKVWHVTEARNIPSIMQKGLEPRIGKSSRQAKETESAIYVFPDQTSMIDAITNWLGDETYRQAVLELTVPKSWVIESDIRWESRILQPVPPSMIKVVVSDIDEWDGSPL